MTPKPRPIKLSRERAKEIISEVAQDSKRVILTTHAEERMLERGITLAQVKHVLRSGALIEGSSLKHCA